MLIFWTTAEIPAVLQLHPLSEAEAAKLDSESASLGEVE